MTSAHRPASPLPADSALRAATMPGFFQPLDAHNQRLREAVAPPSWENPAPRDRYHMVVIGGGTAGLVTAAGAAGLGARVALIERHALGGDCLNVGCVPSKALLAAARSAAAARRAGRFGVHTGEVAVDFPAVMKRLRRLRAEIAPNDSAERFRSLGVDVFLGEARFTGRESIEVGGATLRFSRATIATGARAVLPPIPGLVEAGALTNESVFSLTELPPRLAVIGAGPIGCELAQAFARFGSRVTLFESSAGLLARDDREAAAVVARALARDGVTIVTDARIARVTRAGGVRRIHLEGAETSDELEFDAVLVGAGRAPNVDDLGLEAAGVAFDPRRGVTVDERLRTTNPAIFAAGDVCLADKFTHAADFAARVVIQNALFGGRRRHTDLVVPRCTYTDPELAQVGMSEAGATRAGLAVRVFTQHFHEVDRAILEEGTEGFVRVIVEAKRGRILGATIVGAHAGELISELTVAIQARMTLGALANVIHPYPTLAEAIRKTGDQYNRTRLTPGVKRLLGLWLRWFR